MSEITEIVVSSVAIALALVLLVDWDESRLSDEQLARAWPPATRALLLTPLLWPFWFVSPPVHFWRTRRSLLGVVEGVVWTMLIVVVAWIVAKGIDVAPEPCLPWLLWTSLAAFAGLMLWRLRRGGFVVPKTPRRSRALARVGR
jgi:hypothetical protein